MWESVEAVEIFLDLEIESREVILFLGILNEEAELSVRLDSDVSDREDVERKGGGGDPGVCCAPDEGIMLQYFVGSSTHEFG